MVEVLIGVVLALWGLRKARQRRVAAQRVKTIDERRDA